MRLNVIFNELEENFVSTFDENNETLNANFGEITTVCRDDSVLYTPQDLTAEQQNQARENIGVIDYELPVATDSSLGGIIVGEGLTINDNGVLSSTNCDKTFVYNQLSASAIWIIQHNLEKYPSVDVVDSAGTVVVGEVEYIDLNTIEVSFIGAFSGTAYLN